MISFIRFWIDLEPLFKFQYSPLFNNIFKISFKNIHFFTEQVKIISLTLPWRIFENLFDMMKQASWRWTWWDFHFDMHCRLYCIYLLFFNLDQSWEIQMTVISILAAPAETGTQSHSNTVTLCLISHWQSGCSLSYWIQSYYSPLNTTLTFNKTRWSIDAIPGIKNHLIWIEMLTLFHRTTYFINHYLLLNLEMLPYLICSW